tara:strand:+ start:473 stop:1186 length:714 start_codon:yes stop_codon:yes gene_type:complete
MKKLNKLSVCILCGGRGERLRPLTRNLPKPLIKIKKKEILSHIVDHLKFNGFKEILVATGYKHKLIKNFFIKKYKGFNANIVKTKPNDDIIKRIKSVSKFVKDDLLICYGDTLTDINIKRLYKFHKKNKSVATISSFQLSTGFGILDINKKDNLIFKYNEKPNLDIWFNIGYIILDKKIINKIYDFTKFQYFLNYLVKKKLAKSFKHKGLHITINTVKELEEAKKLVSKFEKNKFSI